MPVGCLLSTANVNHPSEMLSFKSTASICAFFVSSALQFDCHRYLASLKKYTLPERGLFKYLVSPHYTMEVLIYASLSLVAAPAGRAANTTLLFVTGFVVISLGRVAESTRAWTAEKFGKEKINRRWRLIPGVW